MAKTDPESGQASNESLGVSIPDEHVGAFVAEVFEDVERKTTWNQIVSSLVAEDARDEWEALTPSEQVAAVLSTATDYDERATDRLAGIPTDRGKPTPEIREEFDEAMRCRGNADTFRDGVAARTRRVSSATTNWSQRWRTATSTPTSSPSARTNSNAWPTPTTSSSGPTAGP
ncbi:aldehyde dehydrogenase [Halorussus sp. MSC15.2]|uniref:aldehyde dehydrogenase n=1 Tax=Halorussus sp. MSC15.2 TaxID=2283638 RepID=UPI0013D1812D|nr:aldehyde dehydrogenase [Halorussus sp. MSC15.2]NEU55535.1 aldehyde dehydrogenase [Halorussus sp. MSC15.2]